MACVDASLSVLKVASYLLLLAHSVNYHTFCELPHTMFPLTKLSCCIPRILDEKDCPPIGTEFSEEDYPKYFCSLYFPCDSSFNMPLSVGDWLASVFHHELPTSLFLATYSSAQIFTVCNLAKRSFITLDLYDISSSFFHPCK